MKNLTLLLITLIFTSMSEASLVSAKRGASESVSSAYQRSLISLTTTYTDKQTPYQKRKSLAQGFDTSEIKPWSSEGSIVTAFEYIRDLRFLEHKDLNRRLTWLFPDDGCYLRAELAIQKMTEISYPPASKLFIFGKLKALTPNSEKGFITWWYHVVPAYNLNGKVIVFDSSVNPQKPLPVEEFIQLINADNKSETEIEYAICSSHTLSPHDDCNAPVAPHFNHVENLVTQFLDLEWARLEILGRDPQSELGENPPWLKD